MAFRFFEPGRDGEILDLDAIVSFRCACGQVAETDTSAGEDRASTRLHVRCGCGRVYRLAAFLAVREAE